MSDNNNSSTTSSDKSRKRDHLDQPEAPTDRGPSRSWASKQISVDQIPSKIHNGSSVYIGSCASTPEAVLEAMVEDPHCKDIEIIQLLPGGKLPHQQENIDRFRTSSFFCMSKNIYKGAEELNSIYPVANKEGLADYRPMSSSSLPRMLQQKVVRVDVAVIKVTKPHKGFCCLGFGVEHTLCFVRAAKVVIAEVTSYMPYTEGRSKILASEIDYWVLNDEPLKTTEELWPEFIKDTTEKGHSQETLNALGKNMVQLIPDGATLKFGWSPLTYSIFPFLHQRKDLGLHTDVLTESMFRLQTIGVFNNAEKTIDKGSSIVSHAHGSQELYEFVDRNPAVEFQPADYVNDPLVLGKIDNLMVLEGALKVSST
jgi:4-hydroxybutyrate CoA-transferase